MIQLFGSLVKNAQEVNLESTFYYMNYRKRRHLGLGLYWLGLNQDTQI